MNLAKRTVNENPDLTEIWKAFMTVKMFPHNVKAIYDIGREYSFRYAYEDGAMLLQCINPNYKHFLLLSNNFECVEFIEWNPYL